MHRLRQTAAALAAIVTFATVGTAAAAPTPGELKVGVVADISTLDPQLMTNITDASVRRTSAGWCASLGNRDQSLLARAGRSARRLHLDLRAGRQRHVAGHGRHRRRRGVTFERLTGDALRRQPPADRVLQRRSARPASCRRIVSAPVRRCWSSSPSAPPIVSKKAVERGAASRSTRSAPGRTSSTAARTGVGAAGKTPTIARWPRSTGHLHAGARLTTLQLAFGAATST